VLVVFKTSSYEWQQRITDVTFNYSVATHSANNQAKVINSENQHKNTFSQAEKIAIKFVGLYDTVTTL
jgi:hypothetical protein